MRAVAWCMRVAQRMAPTLLHPHWALDREECRSPRHELRRESFDELHLSSLAQSAYWDRLCLPQPLHLTKLGVMAGKGWLLENAAPRHGE